MMKSPFPGMDPYLEGHWRDVHHSFLTYARDELQADLPSELRARLEERVCIEPDAGEFLSFYPDVRVVEHPNRKSSDDRSVAVATASEPIVIDVPESEPATEGYIEIIDIRSGNRVVTVIELLSLTNKLRGDGQDQYLRKQRELLRAKVSLVEIDLLRAGHRVAAVPQNSVPVPHRTAYQICVTRAWRPRKFEFYPCSLKAPLPIIKIPLREQDSDASINVQELIERCYRNGRYDDINYRVAPNPPLTPDDEIWANDLLTNAGLRSPTPD